MLAKTKAVGHSFAPPITAEKLAEYTAIAAGQEPGPVRDALGELCEMVRVFGQTPPSKRPGEAIPGDLLAVAGPHAGKKLRAEIVPLEEAEVKRIDAVVPWPHEIEGYRRLAKTLPPGPVHEALRHLIWYAAQLTRDREPITLDTLKVV
jgi:hypothetical protein